MDLMWVKAYLVFSACLTNLISVSYAAESIPLCETAGAAVLVQVSRKSLKAQFRCGAALYNLDPPLRTGDVYTQHGCISPVKLRSRLPGAQLVCSSKVYNLYTFSVPALSSEDSQLLYYRCISPDRKLLCTVIIDIPSVVTVKVGRASQAANPELPTCSEPGKVVSSYVSETSRRAYFQCGTHLSELDPPAASGRVYLDPKFSAAVPLATRAPGVLVKLAPERALYLLALHRLPNSGPENYFYRCVSPASDRPACTVNIVVPQDAPPARTTKTVLAPVSTAPTEDKGGSRGHHGPIVVAKRVRTCSARAKTILLSLSPHSLEAQFKCAADLSLLDPPILSGNVYTDRTCSRAIPLATLGRGSLHISPGISPWYTVRLREVPSSGFRAVFYKCKSPQTSQECVVEIQFPIATESQPEHLAVRPLGNIPVCDRAGGFTEVNVDVHTKTARFRCGTSMPALHPTVASGQAYTTRSCKAPVTVQDYVGVGVDVSESSRRSYTVSLVDLPKEESKRIYFLCRDPVGAGICKVAINVPRKVLRRYAGLQTESAKVQICHPGADAAIRVSLHAREASILECGSGLTLQPHSLHDVFDNSDGSCSALSTVQGIVPGAQFFSVLRDPHHPAAGSVFVFLVDEAPEQHKELCYHCASSAHMKGHDCRILITVQGRESKGDRVLLGNTVSLRAGGDRIFSGAKWCWMYATLVMLSNIVSLMGSVL